jgi:hypothetical protein
MCCTILFGHLFELHINWTFGSNLQAPAGKPPPERAMGIEFSRLSAQEQTLRDYPIRGNGDVHGT